MLRLDIEYSFAISLNAVLLSRVWCIKMKISTSIYKTFFDKFYAHTQMEAFLLSIKNAGLSCKRFRKTGPLPVADLRGAEPAPAP